MSEEGTVERLIELIGIIDRAKKPTHILIKPDHPMYEILSKLMEENSEELASEDERREG